MDTYRIVAIVFFSLSLAVILLLLIRWCYTQCVSFSTPREDIEYEHNQSINFDITDGQNQFKQEKIQWEQFNNNQINSEKICPICLDANINTITRCNHNFHLNCLIQWKKRGKPKCPFCKTQDLDKIVFLCHQCKKYKFQYTFQMPNAQRKKHMVPKMFLQYLRSQKMLKCLKCKNQNVKNKRKTRIFEDNQKLNEDNAQKMRDQITISQRIEVCVISSQRDMIIQME